MRIGDTFRIMEFQGRLTDMAVVCERKLHTYVVDLL